jgi:hypothetical protein
VGQRGTDEAFPRQDNAVAGNRGSEDVGYAADLEACRGVQDATVCQCGRQRWSFGYVAVVEV